MSRIINGACLTWNPHNTVFQDRYGHCTKIGMFPHDPPITTRWPAPPIGAHGAHAQDAAAQFSLLPSSASAKPSRFRAPPFATVPGGCPSHCFVLPCLLSRLVPNRPIVSQGLQERTSHSGCEQDPRQWIETGTVSYALGYQWDGLAVGICAGSSR